jgi:hypothetical protein
MPVLMSTQSIGHLTKYLLVGYVSDFSNVCVKPSPLYKDMIRSSHKVMTFIDEFCEHGLVFTMTCGVDWGWC